MGDFNGSGWELLGLFVMLMVVFLVPVILLLVQFTYSILYFFGIRDHPFFRKIIGIYWVLLILNTVLIPATPFYESYLFILLSYSAICIPYQILVKRNSHKLKQI
jgi:hypothetical protein